MNILYTNDYGEELTPELRFYEGRLQQRVNVLEYQEQDEDSDLPRIVGRKAKWRDVPIVA